MKHVLSVSVLSLAFLLAGCGFRADPGEEVAAAEAEAARVEELIETLGTTSYDVEYDAAWDELFELGEAAVEPLIGRLDDADPDMRAIAACALVSLRDRRAVEPLIKALGDPDAKVRGWAANAFMFIPDERAIDALVALIRDVEMGRTALMALGAIGPPAVEHLIPFLEDPDPETRRGVAWALGESGGECTLGPLIEALNDADWRVRNAAASAIADIRPGHEAAKKQIPAIIEALKHDNEFERMVAANELNGMGDSRAVEPLIAALDDPGPRVRQAAGRALGYIGGEGVFEALIDALDDPDPVALFGVLTGLGDLGDRRALGLLREMLSHPSEDVRITAERAIETIEGD
ncbi:MAG: HEAT repeat domain-containing protein [Armatimonadetes bacterium]|nr:HEAT repeat domain-containing protein [Armatimonadota bacterium]